MSEQIEYNAFELTDSALERAIDQGSCPKMTVEWKYGCTGYQEEAANETSGLKQRLRL